MKGRTTGKKLDKTEHKRHAQTWPDTDKSQEWNKQVVFKASAAKADAEEHL